MKILLIAILLSLFAFNHSLDPNKVVIAINCGGSEYVDPDGTEYISDDYYNGGTESDYGLQYDIQLTKDVELYQTERWSDKDLVYSLPFDVTSGKYVIILKFSEVYFAQPNEKVFDIGLGSKTIIKNLDIFENVGKAKAHDEYIEFEFKDNQVYFKVFFLLLRMK